MWRHFASKLAQSIGLLIGVVALAFFMLRVTGDPASLMVPRTATAAQVEEFREAMGFNRPVAVQFWDYLTRAAVGDFGKSLHYNLPALPLVLDRLPATIELAASALLMAIILGITLGLLGGIRPGSLVDSIARFVGLLGQSTPSFWAGLVLMSIFAVRLGLLPAFGRDGPKSLILPAFVLGLGVTSELLRLTRSTVLEVRGEDYIRTAFSKGLRPRTVYTKHILRNVGIPLVSIIALNFGYLLGGSIYIETIFAWPGMGQLLQQAIGWRDFPLVQALTIFTAVVVLSLNLLADILYAAIDPRIRHGNRGT